MTEERENPPFIAEERPMLESWLDWHRETLARKLIGLTEEQLKRMSVPPSKLSLLGLVRHMADVERSWFGRALGGQKELGPIFFSTEEPDGDFFGVVEADPEADISTWHTECDRSRKIWAGIDSLDAVGISHRGDEISARWILVHMIEEYARHNGHADFLRETIDGVTGD
jgi:uncharacterized damage-inducible protein DinB